MVYYEPRQSSRCLYADAEFNVRAEGKDGKTASEYMILYDTLSEIGKKKREFVCRETEVKLRSIVLRMWTCRVISHLCRNKLDVAERGKGVQGAKAPVGGLPPPPCVLGAFSAARRGTIKCNFTAAPKAGKERFSCLF